MAVRDCDQYLYPRLDRLRPERKFPDAGRLPRAAGFRRRHADPGGVFRGVPAVSDPFASRHLHDGRHRGGAGADGRPGGPWLFLINVIPGVIAAVATPFLLPRGRPRLSNLVNLDGISLALMAIALASLEIGLKQAPHDGWFSPLSAALFLLCAASATMFASRTLKATHPVVDLSTLKARPFAIGCLLSFCLGVGLFGSIYLMPVFLAFVRHHNAFEIGTIMLVTGAAQLA